MLTATVHPNPTTPASDPVRPATPTVSIVIPAYNEERTIERCLLAAVHQSVPAHEIIVVDNRSTDATLAVAARVACEHPDAPILLLQQTAAQGITPTRNFGFAAATGDVLGRIDADSVIAPDWVARVSHELRNTDVAAVSGPTTYYDLPFRLSPRVSDDLARRALRVIGRRHPFLIGCNMAIRADAWRTIEPATCLDGDDLMHEDIDIAVHLGEAGLVIGYASSLRADVSARRLSTSPGSFRFYTERFRRTYASHGIRDSWRLRAPEVLLRAMYWWARTMRAIAPAPRFAV